MVTFTVRNVPASELQKTVDALMLGYKKMLRGWTLDRRVPKTREYAIFFRRLRSGKLGRFKCVPASNVLLGSIRSLEVTYNRKTRTFHPHIHALFFLGGEYFKFPYYITADEWRCRWRWAMNLDYTPQVRLGRDASHDARINDDNEIQELESDAALGLSANEKVVFEVSKYITDFGLSQRNDDAALDELDTLADVLHGRRILTFTGIARTARKALGLTETPEDEELENEVKPSCNCTKCNSPTWRGLYLWSSQRGFYHLRSTDAEQIDHLELDFKTFLEYRRADIERITTSKLLHEALPQAAYFARLNELKKQEAS